MKTIYVRIPCRRFSVRVKLGKSDGLGPFEAFALRAIADGANTVERLADYLGLHCGLVLDACVDLLRAGYIVVHRVDSIIEVTPDVRDTMGDPLAPREGWAARLAPAIPPEVQEYDLLYDLVSGAVFGAGRGLMRPMRALVAPEDTRIPDVTTVPKPVLLVATASLLRRIRGEREAACRRNGRAPSPDWVSRRGARVLGLMILGAEASSARPVGTPASIVVEVGRKKGLDGANRPNLVIIGPPELSSSIRRRIASALSGLWDNGVARGKDQFFTRIDERLSAAEALIDDTEAEYLVEPQCPVRDLVAELSRLDDPPNLEPKDALEVHDRLQELERRAAAALDAAEGLRASASLVVGAAAHHAALLDALRRARHQVVLSGPWVGQLQASKDIQDTLIDTVARGVRVHLLWGVSRRSRFEDDFGPTARELVALLAPKGQRMGGVYVAQRPASIHAKFMACDMEWAIVTSCNFLNVGPDRTDLDVGVRLTGLGPAPGAIQDAEGAMVRAWQAIDTRPSTPGGIVLILQWLRGLVADFTLRSTLVVDPAVDGRQVAATAVEIGADVEPPGDLRIWRDTFERRAKVLKERLDQVGTVAMPVMDGQHRELFIEGIRGACRRILVSSRNLGVGALGQGAFEALKEARNRGVEVTIVHRGRSEWNAELASSQAELAEAGVRFVERDIHAKILVCDDWAVVTSYNFLSFVGYYDEFRRARHELGLRILDRGLADELAKILLDAPLRGA